ncbi:MAG TPA: anthranilate synthase component I family protein [Planktothrix sp.]
MANNRSNHRRDFAVVTFSSDFGTPVSVFHTLMQQSCDAFLFESTEGDGRLARYSFLGVDPLFTVSITGRSATIKGLDGEKVVDAENPIELLEQLLQEHGGGAPSADGLPDLPFLGGLVGYMGYGATGSLDGIAQQQSDPFKVPDALYGFYDTVVAFDHQYRRVSVVSQRGENHAQKLMQRAMAVKTLAPLRLSSRRLSEEELFENVSGPFDEAKFIEAVQKTKEFIRQGQAFQIVLAQRFSMRNDADPIDVYRMLQATNPSPYAYYLKCPGFVYVGSSPETFVRCREGKVLLRAIAGTRPRGANREQDDLLAAELRANEKEMAEHRMLVDLGRNDLGRVCGPGTIEIGEIACLTKYTHVMHLATEISGILAPDKTTFNAFQSCFPAGTVSGAPKIRAMQLLNQLEPERRGVYSGAVGYFDLYGNMDGAIAIRSALIKDGVAHVNAGAGIVYDSDPLGEYVETRNKAKSLIQAVKLASLAKNGGAQS